MRGEAAFPVPALLPWPALLSLNPSWGRGRRGCQPWGTAPALSVAPVPSRSARAWLSPCSFTEVEGQNVTNNPCNEPHSAELAAQGRVQWGPEPARAGGGGSGGR